MTGISADFFDKTIDPICVERLVTINAHHWQYKLSAYEIMTALGKKPFLYDVFVMNDTYVQLKFIYIQQDQIRGAIIHDLNAASSGKFNKIYRSKQGKSIYIKLIDHESNNEYNSVDNTMYYKIITTNDVGIIVPKKHATQTSSDKVMINSNYLNHIDEQDLVEN